MPTLLQINVCCATLSTGKIAESIGRVAIDNGWDSYIAYGRNYSQSKSKTIKIGNKFSVIEHYIEHRLFDNDGLASRLATKKLIREIEKIQPDIIHLHNIHDHYVNYKILLSYIAKANIPVVWTLHDCWNFTGGCKYFDEVDCKKWETECVKCPQNKSLLCKRTSFHFHSLKRLQDDIKSLTFIPVSNWLKSLLAHSHQAKRNALVIHNGVDLNIYRPLTGCGPSKMILGVAAVWNARKGLDDFIKLRQCLSSDYTIVLVGLSEEQIKSLPKGIKGIRRTSNQEELVRLYSDALAFVNPTYSDNFPTTNIEALACGTPVITYQTGGSPEAIDKDTGIIVEQGDIQGLTSAISEISNNGKQFYTENCRKRAEKLFDKNKKFQEYIDLYTSLLKDTSKIK